MKYCNKCKETKPPEMFHKRNASLSGLQHHCKSCLKIVRKIAYENNSEQERNDLLRRRYNLSRQDYDKILLRQQGLCAICCLQESQFRNGHPPRLSVDHCHATGKIRGLLCNQCNQALGKFKDSPALLNQAIQYLERTSQ